MRTDPCAIILVVCYFYLLTLCLSQIAQVYTSWNKRLTLRMGVIYSLLLSSLIRIIFWVHIIFPSYWNHQILQMIYVLPVWMQIVGLSLLVVFYAQILGRSTSVVPLRICIIGNTVFLVICIILSISSEASTTNTTVKHSLSDVYVAIASFISFLIAGLLGYFGQKFSEFCRTEKVNRSLLPHSEKKFHLMNWILVAIFTLRGILIILSALHIGNFPSDTKIVKVKSGSTTTNMELSYFLITEIIPTSFVLLNLWQTLCPKDISKSTVVIDDSLCNHSEMNAKYNDMFSPRGSQVSRDGDDLVRVVYSSFVLDLQNQSKSNDIENPIPSSPSNNSQNPTKTLSPNSSLKSKPIMVSSSPTSPLHRKTKNQMVHSITITTDELAADLSQADPEIYSPKAPLQMTQRRHMLSSPQISPTSQSSDDNIGEGRPSDSHELQYFHQDLKLDRITPKALIYQSSSNGSTDCSTNSSINSRSDRNSKNILHIPRPHPSITSSISSANSVTSAVPSLKNWLSNSDLFEATPPPLTRPPSAPATTTTSICTDNSNSNNNGNGNNINNTNNSYQSRNSIGNGRTSPFPSILSPSEEKSHLLKQVAKALSPKYILQGHVGSPKPRSNSGS